MQSSSSLFTKTSDARLIRVVKRLRSVHSNDEDGCTCNGELLERWEDLTPVFCSSKIPCIMHIVESAFVDEAKRRKIAIEDEADVSDYSIESSGDESDSEAEPEAEPEAREECPPFKYSIHLSAEELAEKVKGIKFPRTRSYYWDNPEYNKTLMFPEEITVAEAVKKAEEYLSKPLSIQFYETHDNAYLANPRDFPFAGRATRGWMLGELRYLERVEIDPKTKIGEFSIGT